jgi:hypothetical protein
VNTAADRPVAFATFDEDGRTRGEFALQDVDRTTAIVPSREDRRRVLDETGLKRRIG